MRGLCGIHRGCGGGGGIGVCDFMYDGALWRCNVFTSEAWCSYLRSLVLCWALSTA
jgi:hypothetical protein